MPEIRDAGGFDALRKIGSPVDGRVGALDIAMYRDDLSEIGASANVRPTEVDIPIDGLNIVLVDDVLMTGRSARAALQGIMDLGRPRRVWLAVLVDRGGRELPIQADYIGLDLKPGAGSTEHVTPDQRIAVHVQPTDPDDSITIAPAPAKGGHRQ